MPLLPGEDQSLLAGYVFGKQLGQAENLIDLEHKNKMATIELSQWKAYARSLEEALNNINAETQGVVATREALVAEGQSCNHPEHHKLSHNKELRNQMYDKGYAAAEPIIKEPRR